MKKIQSGIKFLSHSSPPAPSVHHGHRGSEGNPFWYKIPSGFLTLQGSGWTLPKVRTPINQINPSGQGGAVTPTGSTRIQPGNEERGLLRPCWHREVTKGPRGCALTLKILQIPAGSALRGSGGAACGISGGRGGGRGRKIPARQKSEPGPAVPKAGGDSSGDTAGGHRCSPQLRFSPKKTAGMRPLFFPPRAKWE